MSRLTTAAPQVSDALNTRFSCRKFLDKAVSEDMVREIIETATRAPSGGNLQPWHVWAVSGAPLQNFIADIQAKLKENPAGETPDYHIYPPDITEPYESRRTDIGERMYGLLGIPRDDRKARIAQLMENYTFFGAPVALFFAIDKQMQQGQWADLGMMMQSIMLLAREKGLHTCPQEIWALWTQTIKEFLHIPDNMMFFCGLALGFADPDALINQLESPRAPLAETVQFLF